MRKCSCLLAPASNALAGAFCLLKSLMRISGTRVRQHFDRTVEICLEVDDLCPVCCCQSFIRNDECEGLVKNLGLGILRKGIGRFNCLNIA